MDVKGFWNRTTSEPINGELWRDIQGFNAYQVSNYGRIRTHDHVQQSRNYKSYRICSGQIIRQSKTHKGYLKVTLYRGNERKNLFVHRLVAKAFVYGFSHGMVVNHINEIKTDNRAINLEWCTPKENSNYGTVRQRLSNAMRNHPNISQQVQAFCKETGKKIAVFPSIREASRQIGCSVSTIHKCVMEHRTFKGLYFVSQR